MQALATQTGRVSCKEPNVSNTPKSANDDLPEHLGSCTFLNMTGDVTIVWEEENRERIMQLIQKKMDEGYTFFTTKKYLFGTITRKGEITKRDLKRGKIADLIIPDDQFDQMIDDLGDIDVADVVRSGTAKMAKRKVKEQLQALERAKSAKDVVGRNSLAVRPIRGG